MNVTSINPSAAFTPSSEPSSLESQKNLTEKKPEVTSNLSTAHESASGSGNYMMGSVGGLFQNVRQLTHKSYTYGIWSNPKLF